VVPSRWSLSYDEKEDVPVPATADAIALAVAAADAADDKKATDLTILDVADLLAVVDLFLLVTTTSDRQLRAVSDGIEERLRQDGRKPVRREGEPSSGWVVLDFEDVVCHLFSTEQREFYALERLWADVPRYDPRTGEPLPPGGALSGLPSAGASSRRIDVVDLA
jgi:ribosome-associated protein